MKKPFLLFFFSYFSFLGSSIAQDNGLPQNFLFDDSDIIVKAQTEKEIATKPAKTEEAAAEAVSSARRLLSQKPTQFKQKAFPKLKNKPAARTAPASNADLKEAPFGLVWGSSILETRNQGVALTTAEMKDCVNSFLAAKLPKPIAFFDRIYVVYGKENELYRILAYSQKVDDDASASKILQQYNSFSELLNKKYGNKQEDFTPAVVSKTIKNAKGQDETVEENAPVGNPNFLEQLQNGTAVLFSTYYNKDVAAALSIGVDDDKKSYIVIDYKNLRILEKQEAKTLDAL